MVRRLDANRVESSFSSGFPNTYQIMAPTNTVDGPAKAPRFIMHRKNSDRIPIECAGQSQLKRQEKNQ
jgi:hypothetical protein